MAWNSWYCTELVQTLFHIVCFALRFHVICLHETHDSGYGVASVLGPYLKRQG